MVIPLILAVVLLVLVLLLRALVAPLLLLASVVLSYAAALGAAGLVLDAIGLPAAVGAMPLQTFLFLVALGVDYTIFLMTRAREEAARLGHRPGVLHALTVTGGVITSAGRGAGRHLRGAGRAAAGAVGADRRHRRGRRALDTLLVRSLLVRR